MIITLLISLLTSNALTLSREISLYYSRIVILGLSSVAYLTYNSLYISSLEKGIGIYGALFNVTSITHVFTIFICLVTSVILILTGFYPRKVYTKQSSSLYNIINSKFIYNRNIISNKSGTQFRIIEYALIIVFVITGGIFLISCADLISIFLSIELQSYGLYIISSIYRDSEIATSSGLVYFLLGGLSSCFILLGSALLYIITGTTNLDNIYLMTNTSDIFSFISWTNIGNLLSDFVYWDKIYYIQLAIIVMLVGFLFKVSAAPFHFWSPDVYDGIPTIVTTFVAIVAKISIFAFLLDFVYQTKTSIFNFSWTSILVLSSFLSLIIGSVLGLTQFRIKRLFAYSTISHVGFILLALSINSPESIQSYIFYILQYSLSNLNAFIILLSIGYTLYLYVYKDSDSELASISQISKYSDLAYKSQISKDSDLASKLQISNPEIIEQLVDKDNSPIQLVSQIKGYFHINPYIAISLAVTLFSFAGIPPIVGFFGKQMILNAALDNGYLFMSLIAILTSVIGAGYYLNLIKNIFFFNHDYKVNPSIIKGDKKVNLVGYLTRYSSDKSREDNKIISNEYTKIFFKSKNITINGSLSTVISIMTLVISLFICTPSEPFNLVNILTLNLFKI